MPAARQFPSLDQAVLPALPLHLAIGMFDGVHLGHQTVIGAAVHSAQRSGGLTGVLTFWPHPSAVLNPGKAVRMLMPPEMKGRVLARLGVDAVIQQPFTTEFAEIGAGDFLPYLKQRLPHLAGIYVGENWRFGAGRRGDSGMLLTEAARHRVPVVSVPRILCNGEPISSTRIRDCLVRGDIEEANLLLGYSYFAEGTVAPGRQLGRKLGFPTLNVPWQPDLQPRHGVYAVRICGGSASGAVNAVANYGVRPTVEAAGGTLLEAHVLGDCPFGEGSHVTIDWIRFLRPERKFGDVDALRVQIAADRDQAAEYFRTRE